jgi:TPP-dependent pyruvate/acetoin dehydrogenase alpha subunit
MPTKTRKQVVEASRKSSPAKKPKAVTPSQAVSSNGSSPSSQETLRRLYASLLRCRLVEEQARQSSKGDYDLSIGHEAVTVGPTAELSAEDTIAATVRNLAALAARGVPLTSLVAKPQSDAAARKPMLPASMPQDPFNLATGIALAHKLEKRRHVVIAFCPQESPALETWHEALKFAGVHKLPVIYVIKNGVADQQSSSDHAPHLEAFSFMARDYGYPGVIVDGQDVVAVWRVAQESLHRARNGSGPTLIDCRTDTKRDPLAHMEHYMRKRNVWDEAWRKQTEREIRGEIEKAGVWSGISRKSSSANKRS